MKQYSNDNRTMQRETTHRPVGPHARLFAWFVLATILFGIVAAGNGGAAAGEDERRSTNPEQRRLWSYKNNTVERRAVERLKKRDLRRISLGQASRFHRLLVETFAAELPEDLEFRYIGPLALENGRPSMKIEGQGFTSALSWHVQKSVVLFRIWISTLRTETTLAECQVGGGTLFLNVNGVDKNRSVDEKLPELGGRSVNETLRLLESACAAGKKQPPAPAGGKAEDETEAKPADRSIACTSRSSSRRSSDTVPYLSWATISRRKFGRG